MRSLLIVCAVFTLAAFTTGCAAPSTPTTPGQAPQQTQSPTADWEGQARLLGRVIVDLLGSVSTEEEPAADTDPDGTYTVLVTSIDLGARTITVDRSELHLEYDDAVAAAERDGVALGEDPVYASNRIPESLTLPVADDAAFVVFYPGEDALNAAPRDFASMSALTLDELAKWSETPENKVLLEGVGGWLSVEGGKVTSFLGVPGV